MRWIHWKWSDWGPAQHKPVESRRTGWNPSKVPESSRYCCRIHAFVNLQQVMDKSPKNGELQTFFQYWKEGRTYNNWQAAVPPLTSTIGKLMERLVTNYFRYITEDRHFLSENQARLDTIEAPNTSYCEYPNR